MNFEEEAEFEFENMKAEYVLKVSFDDYENTPYDSEYSVEGVEGALEKYKELKITHPRYRLSAYLVLEKSVEVDVDFN